MATRKKPADPKLMAQVEGAYQAVVEAIHAYQTGK